MHDPDPAELLAEHATWLRGLARALVRDEALADDLAQDAAVAALERPPTHGSSVRAWLRSVVVNRLRELTRERAHRESRERLAARAEAVPASDELVARVQIEQLVVDRVLALDDAHRTVLLMRFHDGLPPREIARVLGIPVATVKSRLERALAKLRLALDREHGGDRRAWLSAVLPLAWEFRSAAWKAGGAWMGAKIVTGVVVLGALVAWWALAPSSAPGERARVAASWERVSPMPQEDAERDGPGTTSPAATSRSEVALVAGASPSPAAPASAGAFAVRGRVLDATGAPLAGVRVAPDVALETERAQSSSNEDGARTLGSEPRDATPASAASHSTSSSRDAVANAASSEMLSSALPEASADSLRGAISARDGGFELAVDGERASLVIDDARWATIRPGSWRRESALSPIVVGARAIAVDGVVVDP